MSTAAQSVPATSSEQNGSEGQASPALRAEVLKTVYEEGYLEKFTGRRFLVACHVRLRSGIFIVDGNFGREQYKVAMQEAKDAGLNTSNLYVYGRTATYSGRGICFAKFDEIGITA